MNGHLCVCAKLLHLCPIPCDLVDCSLPGSSVHGILQARILEWVAIHCLQGIFLTQGSNPSFLHLPALVVILNILQLVFLCSPRHMTWSTLSTAMERRRRFTWKLIPLPELKYSEVEMALMKHWKYMTLKM